MKSKPLIWVEGIIGAGKSTLAEILGNELNMRIMHEPVESNPYLDAFYKDNKTHAFAMQIHLLSIRAGMQDLAAEEVMWGDKYNGAVLDRALPGDHAFARLHMVYGNMSKLNYETYRLLYLQRTNKMKPPSVMLFLDVEPEVAFRRVKERARGAEVGMTLKYLQDLRDQYLDLMVELQNGDHEWAGKVDIRRIAWNADNQPTTAILSMLKDKFAIR